MQKSESSFYYFAKKTDLYNHVIQNVRGGREGENLQTAFKFLIVGNTTKEERTILTIKQSETSKNALV